MIARIAGLTSLCLLLAACGGPETSQANNTQANMSGSASPPATAVPTTISTPTGAPKTKDEALKIMHERHEGMEGMGKAMKTIGRELKSSSPNVEAIRTSAKAITDFAPHAAGLFPPGTGPEVGKTGAKPAIWQNSQDFTAKAGDFQKAAEAFGGAAQKGDVAAIKSGFSELGQSCKACHDKYRSEMHH
jgi:cytochrome c556